jgi:uncharacterized membrane protein YesL
MTMSVRSSLRAALAETYRWSWRLLVVNSALSAAVIAVVLAVSWLPLALLLGPLLAGPVAAALVYCTVKVIREEELVLADALAGLRLHWRRGLELGALFGLGLLLGVLAVAFYTSERHRVWPLAALAVYLLGLYLLVVLLAWPLAIAEPQLSLGSALRQAFLLLLRRPLRLLGLGTALLLVNALGAVTVVPILTLTIAYSFLVAGHLVLPEPSTPEEVTTPWRA